MRRPSVLALAVLLASPAVFAGEAFKCTAADGSVSFQDRPCRDASRQQRLHLPEYAPSPPPADDVAVEAKPADSPPTTPTTPAVPREPPPSFFLCTRYDGSRYASDTGIGSTSWLPADLIHSNRDLASAYAGPNGVGVSAPGLREPPRVTSAFGGISYVRWDDACHRASAPEACAYLRTELDGVRDKLKRAFSDTQAELEQQERQLRERLRGC